MVGLPGWAMRHTIPRTVRRARRSLWAALLACLAALPATLTAADAATTPVLAYLPADELAADSIDHARDLARDRWRELSPGRDGLGVGNDEYWFRLEVPSLNDYEAPVLEVVDRGIFSLTVFAIDSEGRARRQGPVGFLHADDSGHSTGDAFGFPLATGEAQPRTIYLRAQFHGRMQMPVRIVEADRFVDAAFVRMILGGFVLGALAAILAYNLVILIFLRQLVYALYVLHVAGLLLWFSIDTRLATHHFWPGSPVAELVGTHVALPLMFCFSLAFSHCFLDLREQSPRFSRALSAAGFAMLAAALWALLVDYGSGAWGFICSAIAICLLLVAAGIHQWWRGYRAARWYTVAWSGFLLGSIVATGVFAGWLPAHPLLEHAQRIGGVAETALLSLALAARIRRADYARRAAEERAAHQEAEHARALSAERERMIQDFHDGAGHKLVTLIRWVEQEPPGRLALLTGLRDIHAEIRMTVFGLNPQASSVGIVFGRLRDQIGPRLEEGDIHLDWAVDPATAGMREDPGRLLEIIRITQEAVTNAIKHAEPSTLRIQVGVRGVAGNSVLHVNVFDDGKGFAGDAQDGGLGLHSMQRRAARLGAAIEVASQPGEGTRVMLTVPCHGADSDASASDGPGAALAAGDPDRAPQSSPPVDREPAR